MEIDKLKISEGDFDLFAELEPRQKLEFLWDAQYVGLEASILKQLDKLDRKLQPHTIPKALVHDFEVGNTRLCVTMFDNMIYMNSSSLQACKRFVNKLWLDGHIMVRRHDISKTVYDIYKYFRAYEILGKGTPFSQN